MMQVITELGADENGMLVPRIEHLHLDFGPSEIFHPNDGFLEFFYR
jgi:hypothetical protein